MAVDTAFDCSTWPEESKCSVKITGEHDDVVAAAAHHRAALHQDDADAARTQISDALDDPALPFAWRI